MSQEYLNYIPAEARDYCRQVTELYSFKFILKRKRATKLGDFRHDRASGKFTISVNCDLNPYQFLITFVHELAHLKVAIAHHRTTKSHGKEWKDTFSILMQPLLTEDVFPASLLPILIKHMKNPKAAAGSDPKLWQALRAYDIKRDNTLLNDLDDGSSFIFRKKQFKRIEKRRTRILCQELNSRRLYLIPGIADVEIIL